MHYNWLFKNTRIAFVVFFQLLLQKEREDTASYKSSLRPELSKQNDVHANSASPFTAQELTYHANSPPDRVSAPQNAYAHPVAIEGEFLRESMSPKFAVGAERMSASADNGGMTPAPSRQISDSAAVSSLAGTYHSFRNIDEATAVLHRSLDSTLPPALKSSDLLPQYLTKHASFPGGKGLFVQPVSASSRVANAFQSLSASVNDSMNLQSHLDFGGAFADGAMSDEAAHSYAGISGNYCYYLVKIFFGYYKYDSVTLALFETRVPSFGTTCRKV